MNLEKFKAQVLPLKDKFYRYALWQVKNREEAEDLVQEAFIRLWKVKDKLGLYNSIEALGYRVIKNIFLDHQRRQKKSYVELNGLDFEASDHGPGAALEFAESEKIISRIVSELPDSQREILRLRNVEGYSMKRISELTGIKTNTVEVTLSRIRKRLRQEYLNEQQYESKGN